MKSKISSLLFLFIITIVFHPNLVYADDSLPRNDFTIPAELVLSSNSITVDAFFFPIGWSEKGLFAYAGISPLIGNNGYSVSYAVLNLTTDSCLWHFNDFGEYPEPHTTALKTSWSKQQKILNTTLFKYGIVSREIGKFTRFPFKYGDDSVYSEYKLQRENSCAGNPIVDSDLYIRTTTNGSKRVAHQLYGCDAPGFSERSSGALDAIFIVGGLVSPFEPRVAIISGLISAYGESPQPTMYKINGAHIVKGFSRK